MSKYHVALSFAGEDRTYVDSVATLLRAEGVDVFYDLFEEADLWGRDLYAHLSDVYQNKALFTVMFVSEAYRTKLWTNHERQSAQARAFSDSREYILPAFFDESIEVPGLLKTTGYVSLKTKTPEQLAALIVQKLRKSGVRLTQQSSYSDNAKADVDFPPQNGRAVSEHDFVLAHISDLHFSEGTDQSNPNHAHSIEHLIGLQNRLAALSVVDCLIVSGDVSNHGDRQSLITANGWLFRTIPIGNGEYTGLNMPNERVRVVPGNHDAWNATESGHLIDRRQKSLEHFNFAFPQHQIPHGGCYFDWQQKGDNGLYIALVDSCFLGDTEQNEESTFGTLRFDQALAKGRLTVEQAEQLLEWHDQGIQGRLDNPHQPGTCIDRNVFAASLKILVMHHYLFEPPEKKSDYFMRIQHRDIVFRNIALSDFDVLMCGHKHVAAFDVHDYGDHFDDRAVNRYMTNYFRRLIGLESLPIQFVDEKGRRLSKALTQVAEIIGNYYKRIESLFTATPPTANDPEIAEKVFQLLKSGLDNPENLKRTVEIFLHEAGATGASILDSKELKTIQKRVTVGLSTQERKELRKVADSISAISRELKTRQFLQLMSGSSAKASSAPKQKRSFHVYRIRRDNGGWHLVCERYNWDGNAFSNMPTSRNHYFKKKI